jgi:hypothetical protein
LLPDLSCDFGALEQDVIPQDGRLCLACIKGIPALVALDRGPSLLGVHCASGCEVGPDWIWGPATLAAAALAAAGLAAAPLTAVPLANSLFGSPLLPCDLNFGAVLVNNIIIHDVELLSNQDGMLQ